MIRSIDNLIAEVTTRHILGEEVPLAVYVAQCPNDNDALGDLVDADAQGRISQGLPVTLELYLEAIPDLPERVEVLDAALGHALDSLVRELGCSTEDAIDLLIEQHPELAEEIQVSGLLSDFIWSSDPLNPTLSPPKPIELPCDTGPEDDQGRRRYELRRLIGRGAQGSVYEAMDRLLSDHGSPAWVAIKVLHSWKDVTDSRLEEEGKKARRVDHLNIARVLDLGRTDSGEPFVVYEHLDGGPLRRPADTSPTPLVRLVSGIARGLQAAHTAGLVHRDLKPGNILLSHAGVPKITDFGLASAAYDEHRVAGGTPAFVAPEQYRNEPTAHDVTADVYALGGILFWLLTGKPPNGEVTRDVVAFLSGETTRRVRVSDFRPIDPDLDAICARAMQPDPALRYQSADSFAADLESWLEHRPIEWTHPSPTRRTKLMLRRRPWAVLSVALVAGLLAVGTGIFVYITQQNAQRRAADAARIKQATLEADLSKAKEQAVTAEFEGAKSAMAMTASMFKNANGNFGRDWITIVSVFEALNGPLFSGESEEGHMLWETRIQAVQNVIAQSEASGFGDELDTGIWRVVLSYWLLRDGRTEEAVDLASQTRSMWTEQKWPPNPYLSYIDVIEGSGIIALASPEGGPINSDRVRTSLEMLERARPTFVGPRQGTRLHRLCLLAMTRGLDAIEMTDEREEIQRELNQYKD